MNLKKHFIFINIVLPLLPANILFYSNDSQKNNYFFATAKNSCYFFIFNLNQTTIDDLFRAEVDQFRIG